MDTTIAWKSMYTTRLRTGEKVNELALNLLMFPLVLLCFLIINPRMKGNRKKEQKFSQ